MKISACIRSLRLRTLPLSLAGVVLGIMLAAADYKVSVAVAVLIMLTTACLQLLSNLSNELGDVLRGTDTEERQGYCGGFNNGDLTVSDMKILIGIFFCLCIVFGLTMIKVSFGTFRCIESICLMLLGAAAISGAMRYTLGRNPYGYRGLGDIFVFIFFGIVSVAGAYFVSSHVISSWVVLLPAAAIGCFSVGVLNVNNIRDAKTDAATRVTVAILLGPRRARIYQTLLIVAGWAFMLLYCAFRFFDPWHYLFVLTLPLFIVHLRGVWTRDGKDLDKMLPLLVMATFLFAILAGLGFMIFLF